MAKLIIYDTSNRAEIDGVVENNAELFLTALKERNFDAAVVVAGFGENPSIGKFTRLIAKKAPFMSIIVFGYFGQEEDVTADAVFADIPNKAKMNGLIGDVLETVGLMHRFGLIGRAKSMGLVAQTIARIADSDLTVLVTGESGTGKELVAKAIHEKSLRRSESFIAINCGAIPETLLESQLFGHKKGSFTGAHKDFPGFFAQAERGTLFLDEIGEVPLSVQVKLLRVIESGEYFPVGSSEPMKSDVRIIAATNRELRILMAEKVFRQDLYYRLSGVRITLPPLRDRSYDIPVLIAHFTKNVASKTQKPQIEFGEDALDAMLAYHWPGNVRELRNLVETASVLATGRVIRAVDLQPYFMENKLVGRALPAIRPESAFGDYSALENVYAMLQQNNSLLLQVISMLQKPQTVEDAEKEQLLEALKNAGNNRKKTADSLGISARTLYRKMKKFGVG
jgi:two-component system, NtrC family, response regulator HydG